MSEIIVRLDVMLAKRKMKSKELAQAIGLSEQNLSALRSGRAKGVRFSTLSAICRSSTVSLVMCSNITEESRWNNGFLKRPLSLLSLGKFITIGKSTGTLRW